VQVRGSAFLAGLEDRAVAGQVAVGGRGVGEQRDPAGGEYLGVGGADENGYDELLLLMSNVQN
jgi:hypothetical protein